MGEGRDGRGEEEGCLVRGWSDVGGGRRRSGGWVDVSGSAEWRSLKMFISDNKQK